MENKPSFFVVKDVSSSGMNLCPILRLTSAYTFGISYSILRPDWFNPVRQSLIFIMPSNHLQKSNQLSKNNPVMESEVIFDAECAVEQSDEGSIRRNSLASVMSQSSASSEQSDTSTIKYDQEPWALYRIRVEQLCHSLWPSQKTFRSRLSDNNVVARLRSRKFLRSIMPASRKPSIERLAGGDYNRITGITLPSYFAGHSKLILRSPREKDLSRPDRDVAILRYLRQHSSIPVATIAGYDFTCNNPLDSPYVLQHRAGGKDLEKLWADLTHAQRRTVAIEIGRVLRNSLSLEAKEFGTLQASAGDSDSSTIAPFELKNALGETYDEPERLVDPCANSHNEHQTTSEFFIMQFNRWRAIDLERHAGEISHQIRLWDGLLAIVQDMDRMGLFEAELKNCLCHVDLHPRNIMVDVGADASLSVTAILDWDEAVFAPKFVNCQPPLWLWDDDADERVDEDGMDPWPYELPCANGTTASANQAELKQIFEEQAGPDYCRWAYEDVFRLGRGLFRLATLGLVSSENWKAAEKMLKDWEVLRPSLA